MSALNRLSLLFVLSIFAFDLKHSASGLLNLPFTTHTKNEDGSRSSVLKVPFGLGHIGFHVNYGQKSETNQLDSASHNQIHSTSTVANVDDDCEPSTESAVQEPQSNNGNSKPTGFLLIPQLPNAFNFKVHLGHAGLPPPPHHGGSYNCHHYYHGAEPYPRPTYEYYPQQPQYPSQYYPQYPQSPQYPTPEKPQYPPYYPTPEPNPSQPPYYPTEDSKPKPPTYYPTPEPNPSQPPYYPTEDPKPKPPTYYPTQYPTQYPSQYPTQYPSQYPTQYPSNNEPKPQQPPTYYPPPASNQPQPPYYPSSESKPQPQPTYPTKLDPWQPDGDAPPSPSVPAEPSPSPENTEAPETPSETPEAVSSINIVPTPSTPVDSNGAVENQVFGNDNEPADPNSQVSPWGNNEEGDDANKEKKDEFGEDKIDIRVDNRNSPGRKPSRNKVQ